MSEETPAAQADWWAWAHHPNHGPLVWRTEGVEHRPTHKEAVLKHWGQVPRQWQKGFALYDPDTDVLYMHGRDGSVPEEVSKLFSKWYPKTDAQVTSLEHLVKYPDLPSRYSNQRFARALPNFQRYAADVRELAAKMVEKLKHRPDLQKLRDEAMAASAGINAVTDDEERAQRWQVVARWEIVRDALTMLAAQYPESFKLFPWAVTQLKRATIPPDALLDDPMGPRIHFDGWADVPLGHVVDEIGQAGKMLNEMRQQNRVPEGLDVNKMTLLELSEWKAEQMALLAGEEWEDEERVFELSDGWYIAEVKGQADMAREGELMGHCVGGYCDIVEAGNSFIYSLRDSKGLPHATIEMSPVKAFKKHVPEMNQLVNVAPGQEHEDGGRAQVVRQVQGKSDSVPIPEYLERIKQWMKAYEKQTGIKLLYSGTMGENVDDEDYEINSLHDLGDFWEAFKENPASFSGGHEEGEIREVSQAPYGSNTSDLTKELDLPAGQESGSREVYISDYDDLLSRVMDSESWQPARENHWGAPAKEKVQALYAALLASGRTTYQNRQWNPETRTWQVKNEPLEPHQLYERAEAVLDDWRMQEMDYLWDSYDPQEVMEENHSDHFFDHDEDLAISYNHPRVNEIISEEDEIIDEALTPEEREQAQALYEALSAESRDKFEEENSQYSEVYPKIVQPLYQLGTWMGPVPTRPPYYEPEALREWRQKIVHPTEWYRALDQEEANKAYYWREQNKQPEPYAMPEYPGFQGLRRMGSKWLGGVLEKKRRHEHAQRHGQQETQAHAQSDHEMKDESLQVVHLEHQGSEQEAQTEWQKERDDQAHDQQGHELVGAHAVHGEGGEHQFGRVDHHTNEVDWRHARSVTADADHSGAMIALFIPHEQAQNLALSMDDAEPSDDLHITLAYFEDKAKDRDDWEVARRVAAEVAREHPTLTGEISGFGHFKNGDGPVLWASVDIPGLDKLRVDLVEKLEGAGFPISNEHGFTPHVTLLYGETDPPEGQIGTKLEFDHITSVVDDEREEHELSAENHLAATSDWVLARL